MINLTYFLLNFAYFFTKISGGFIVKIWNLILSLFNV